MIATVLSAAAGLATTWLEGRAVEKKASAEAKAKVLVKAAESAGEWERVTAAGMASSWKDEAWTVCFIAIIAACFIPPLQPYVQQGFSFLEQTPEWFQWSVMASIAASFGLRGFDKIRRR